MASWRCSFVLLQGATGAKIWSVLREARFEELHKITKAFSCLPVQGTLECETEVRWHSLMQKPMRNRPNMATHWR